MSVILNNNELMTLVEANKRAGFVNNEAFFADLAKEHNILDVMPFYPASDGTFHKYTKAKSLGKGAWRDLNEGYTAAKGTVESITTPVQLYSAISNVSEDTLKGVAAQGRSAKQVRNSEDVLVARGIVEDFMDSLINSTGANPKAMKGFEFFRNKLGTYCLDGGGTKSGSLTSIYLMDVGEYKLNCRYTPGLSGGQYGVGMAIQDRGKAKDTDANGKAIWTWSTTFDLSAALELRSDKALVRIANIDYTAAFKDDLFIDAMQLMDKRGMNAVALVPGPIHGQLMKYAKDKNNVNFSVDELENFGRVLKVFGVPVLPEDAIGLDQKKYAA